MSLFIEYHVIQNFAPSNLNRDDTGAPKDALFGGHRRARISSQCFKRAVRLSAASATGIPPEARGVRTKRLQALLTDRLQALGHADAAECHPRIELALGSAGLQLDDEGKTQYLMFLGQREVDSFAALVHEHWDALAATPAVDGKAKKTKKEAKAEAPEAVRGKARKLLDGGKALDVALFGRMLADLPESNQDAACQVAHAISTHRVEREFDYFTAVDDLGGAEETGAGMIGQVEFNSATFYRYALLDVGKLLHNLQGDTELCLKGIGAFTQAFARAVPTGKQNTFAAHNAPSFVGIALRNGSAFNLANAFEKPVWPNHQSALTTLSVRAMAAHERQLSAAFGDARDAWSYLDLSEAWPADLGTRQDSLDQLAHWVTEQVVPRLAAAGA